jgi:hypothetical protein
VPGLAESLLNTVPFPAGPLRHRPIYFCICCLCPSEKDLQEVLPAYAHEARQRIVPSWRV